MSKFKKYLFSCFLLVIPVFAWDLVFTKRLPAAYQPAIFWKDIPLALTIGENVTRVMLFLMMAMMPISIRTKKQKAGIVLYTMGLVVYFTAWLVLMYANSSFWSHSIPGFMSPAYTPALWLAGIGFISNRTNLKEIILIRLYFIITVAFLLLHNYHAYLVYRTIQPPYLSVLH